MRIHPKQTAGSVLLIFLVITAIAGVTLASYLSLVSNQNLSIMRSMGWNEGVAVAEAGIEEAMAHLNRNRTNRWKDGWVLQGSNVVKEVAFGRQRYKTTIEAYADKPNITSEGWVKHPSSGNFLPRARTVKVSTTNDAIFAKGMVAKGQIDLAGNGILSDSFDSSNTNKSTGGQYDPAKRGDKGDVATNASLADSLNVWNAEIYGKASTGPGGDVGIKNGTVGSLAFHASGSTGIETGWSDDDMNVYFPDVDLPTPLPPPLVGLPSTWLPQQIMVNGVLTSFDYVVPPGNYRLTQDLNLNNRKMYFSGPTTLILDKNLSISGQGGMVLGTNANLQLYMNGPTATIAGNGINNLSGIANNFNYWGTPNNKELTIQGNGDWIGTVYAPQAVAKFGGGGATGDDFSGAMVVASVKLNGHYKFHYDEATGVYGPRRGYTITSWNEL